MFKNICRPSIWIRNRPTTPPTATNTITATTNTLLQEPATSGNVRSLSGTTSTTATATTTNPPWRWLPTAHSIARNMASEASAPQAPKHTNRLAQEKSPYLLQHAHNPVDWYPWGEEAIERARSENKLIFLSVGYSTCHWCHVMEHESFENESVAALMNANFVNVKVDREERPDIDKIYMQFLVMMNGSGGWPMSVWLTPDLAPITAGTYFPPHDRWGMPSFTTVLRSIAAKWGANQSELKATGLRVISMIRKSLSEKTSEASFEPGSADAKLQEALSIFKQRFDQEHGGFGKQPKFPEVSRLNFLFHAYVVTKDTDVLDIALQSLGHIGRGGIHDHVFGGFARYSVDRVWHVPHFEKMLYDQGQLMSAYATAYKLTQDASYLQFGDGIFRYLLKDLQHPGGGFYAGEDADSLPTASDTEKIEGAFYAWTWAEVKEAIAANTAQYDGMDATRVFDIYASHYDIQKTGNVEPSSDPHGHLNAKNILIVRGSEEETATNFDITREQLTMVLSTTNEVLHKIRDKRPRPHLDTKIICAWNGLVLSGLAKMANCGSAKSDEYRGAAKRLTAFIRENHFDKERNMLLRSCYGVDTSSDELANAERIDGFLDDYAFLIKGLLDYYKASLDASVLQWAKKLQDIQDTLFWDDTHGAYFYSQANSPNVIVRLKDDHDGAEPSGNSVSARNLILLSQYYDDESYRQRAGKLLEFFADQHPFGYALPEMMCALMLHEFGLDLVAVVGPESETTQSFVEICRKFYVPGMIIMRITLQPNAIHSQRLQEKFKMLNGKPTVYICHDKVCRMPVTDAATLEENLRENFSRNVI